MSALKDEDNKPDKFETFNVDYTEYKTKLSRKYTLRKKYIPPDPKKILSFIPGTINKIYVKEHDKVKAGDKLLILEAMKMQNEISANCNGVIRKIRVQSGQSVMKDELLVEISSIDV